GNADVADYHYNLGLALAGQGRPAEAGEAFRRAIVLKPDFVEAHNNLGNALKEQGKLEEAIQHYQRALDLNPDYAAAHSNLGVILQDRGDTPAALEHYRKAVAIDPSDADAHYNLANAFRVEGLLSEAANAYRKAVALHPDFADAYVNLGMTLRDLGALEAAIAAYRKALAIEPKSADAWIQLGNVLQRDDNVHEAIGHYRNAIEADPHCAEAHYNLGNALREAGDLIQAIAALKRATTLKPDFAQAYDNLGDALWEAGQFDDALIALQRAIALSPNSAEAHSNVGNVLKDQGRLSEAILAYEKALTLKPAFPAAYNNFGKALEAQGRLDEALAAYRRALTIDPHLVEAHSNLLLGLHYRVGTEAKEILVECKRWSEQYAAAFSATSSTQNNDRSPDRRLHIGYLSPDFRAHSVAAFVEPLLTHHNREAFEVTCYANVPRPDALTQRFQGLADRWRDIWRLDDEATAELIREDRVDILVDLAGHTAHNRLLVFARKPAPVQVAYLGYPDTRGIAAIDYWLTDDLADPPGADRFYVERLVRLPQGFNCYHPPADCPTVGALPALAAGRVTLGSFNNAAKLNERVIACWASVLKALPETQLILKAQSLADAGTQKRFAARFEQHGVSSKRVEMIGSVLFRTAHLDLYNRIDIALDCFPYNGHTTTCEALWMGVPVITLAGETHAGRVGVSLLSYAGLAELIADSTEAYVKVAVSLARDLTRLQTLRQGLREHLRHSPLTDAKGFTRTLEAAYRQMWTNYCNTQCQMI
ncbi:MAG: tetratricopeptide repeat protein, partial [Acidiferrobacterales bacterium]